MAGKQSVEMAKAQKLVTLKGATPAQAARDSNVAVQSIYRSRWYKDFKAAKCAAPAA